MNLSKNLTSPSNKVKDQIKYLQKRLVDWGLLVESDVDGIFGKDTEQAVKTFQDSKDLTITGIVDSKTWIAIETPSKPEVKTEIPVTTLKEKNDFNLDEAVKLIIQFEGLSLKAYRDPGSRNGLPITIGYGSTRKRDGSTFKLGERLTSKTEAYDLLMYQLETQYLPKLQETIPNWEKLTVNQKNALISFAYNCGASFYGNSGYTTISKYLEDKTYSMIPKAMMLYVNPGTNVEKGLRNRRQLEGQLFSKV